MISPAQLKEIFQSFPDNCVLLKPDLPKFKIIEVNRSFEEITGIKKEKLLGSDLIEFFTGESVGKEFEDIRASKVALAVKLVDQLGGEVIYDSGETYYSTSSFLHESQTSLEREKLRLADLHRGIKDMKHIPTALFIVDVKHEKIAVDEAGEIEYAGFSKLRFSF